MMTIQERRQHSRVEDIICFDYYVMNPGEIYTDAAIISKLIGDNGKKFSETRKFFQNIDTQLSLLTNSMSRENQVIAECMNLLNSKIDFLFNQFLLYTKLEPKHVSISLGGMAFETPKQLPEDAKVKILLYVKPMMVPLIVDGRIIYCKLQPNAQYRTAVTFTDLKSEHEHLLSQHILFAQAKDNAV